MKSKISSSSKMKPALPINLIAAVLHVAVSRVNQLDPGTQNENIEALQRMIRALLENTPSVWNLISILKVILVWTQFLSAVTEDVKDVRSQGGQLLSYDKDEAVEAVLEKMASFKKMLRGLLEDAPSIQDTIGILKELHKYINP
ncbi:uncharacterized protein LOC128346524 isoform X2 [Hemicordylus capensis]|uniref:uncharacterized protein LOC128346524 isoform X2 n=1 Tax=Hemicordylus capensis TaxID=884348 RepID=UPI00230485F0|nr:uncharacterized protein LOC128346524 isoform X2 [Hemicordylus capensis]